jgi:hypothetical protein
MDRSPHVRSGRPLRRGAFAMSLADDPFGELNQWDAPRHAGVWARRDRHGRRQGRGLVELPQAGLRPTRRAGAGLRRGGPPVVHLILRADHHDSQTGGEESVDDLAVAALDRYLYDTGAVQPPDELAQPGAGGVDKLLLDDGALAVHDGDGVIGGGPVQAGGEATGRRLRHDQGWMGGGVRHVVHQRSKTPAGPGSGSRLRRGARRARRLSAAVSTGEGHVLVSRSDRSSPERSPTGSG